MPFLGGVGIASLTCGQRLVIDMACINFIHIVLQDDLHSKENGSKESKWEPYAIDDKRDMAGHHCKCTMGTTFLGTYEVLKVWGPITASALRFAVAATFLGVVLKLASYPFQFPKSKESWGWTIMTAVLGFGLLYPLQSKGLTLISTGFSAILMLTAPLFLVALSAFSGTRVNLQKWIGIMVGMFGGIALVCDRQQIDVRESTMLGVMMTIGASVCLAATSLTSKKALATINQGSLTFWSMLLGAVILAPFSIAEPSTNRTMPAAWGWLFYLAIVCSVIAFLLWNYALHVGESSTIASTMHIKTPIAVAIGSLENGESLSWLAIIGGGLVGAGVWVALRPAKHGSQMTGES